MKRQYLTTFPLMFALILAALRVFAAPSGEAREVIGPRSGFSAGEAHYYDMDLALDTSAHTLSGVAKVSYYNASDAVLSEAAFQLYPNAYAQKPPMDAARYCPDGFDPGWIKLDSVSAGGESVEPRFENGDMLALVPLNEPLPPGKSVSIEIGFTTKLPKNRMRFGYYEAVYSVTGAYPIAAEYGGGEWHANPYPAFGDPFYSCASSYDVRLSVPENVVVAATGKVTGEKGGGGVKTLSLTARGAREFAFCASERYEVYKTRAGGVEVELYADASLSEENRRYALTTASKALQIFSKRFGTYPFSRLCVAQSGLLDGGMEYPGIMLLDAALFEGGMEHYLEHIVVHEAAHQWWYALVGSDQYKKPWIDEALTEYSTIIYYEDRYGKERAEKYYTFFVENSYGDYMDGRGGGALSDYSDARRYSANVYARGARMYAQLRQQMGDRAFFAALKEYASENAYKIADEARLISTLRRYGADLAPIERFINGDAAA